MTSVHPVETTLTIPGNLPSHSLLAACESHWRAGEWEELIAKIGGAELHLVDPPQRAMLYVWLACANLEDEGDTTQIQRLVNLAKSLGVEADTAARAMIHTVHITLGRAAMLLGDHERCKQHFDVALACLDRSDPVPLETSRSESLPIGVRRVDPYLQAEMLHLTYPRWCITPLVPMSDRSVAQISKCSGSYESWMLTNFERVSDRGMVCVDVGANVGIVSMMLTLCAEGTKVYAFEPVPHIFEFLKANTQGTAGVEPLLYALGADNGMLEITVESKEDGYDFGGAMASGIQSEGSQAFTVNQLTLDDWWSGHFIERLDIVKIDVEGFEWRVVQGARATLERFKPVLFVEYFPEKLRKTGSDHAWLLIQYLKTHYELVCLIDRADGSLKPIKSQADLLSMMVTGPGVEDIVCASGARAAALKHHVTDSQVYRSYGASFVAQYPWGQTTHLGQYPDGWTYRQQTAVIVHLHEPKRLRVQLRATVLDQHLEITVNDQRHVHTAVRNSPETIVNQSLPAGRHEIFLQGGAEMPASSYFQNNDERDISFNFHLEWA